MQHAERKLLSMSSVSMHLALVPGDTGRGSSSQKMAVFQTPSIQIELVYEVWVRRFGLKYLWMVDLSAVRSEIGRGLEDFTNLLCEIHCFYGNNLINFLRSRPSTACEVMLRIHIISSKKWRLILLQSVGDSWWVDTCMTMDSWVRISNTQNAHTIYKQMIHNSWPRLRQCNIILQQALYTQIVKLNWAD